MPQHTHSKQYSEIPRVHSSPDAPRQRPTPLLQRAVEHIKVQILQPLEEYCRRNLHDKLVGSTEGRGKTLANETHRRDKHRSSRHWNLSTCFFHHLPRCDQVVICNRCKLKNRLVYALGVSTFSENLFLVNTVPCCDLCWYDHSPLRGMKWKGMQKSRDGLCYAHVRCGMRESFRRRQGYQ